MQRSIAPPRSAPTIHADIGRWPLVVVRAEGDLRERDFEAYLRVMSDIIQRPGPRAVLMDATDCTGVNANIRRMQGDWLKRHKDAIRERTVGMAFVIPSGLVRGFLTAIFWIQPLECPHAVVGTRNEAIEQCRTWLAGVGATLELA